MKMKPLVARTSLIVLLICVLTTVACAPVSYRAHHEFESRVKEINSPGMLPPDVKVYELTAGGVQELKDEWCQVAQQNVVNAVHEAFRERPMKITELPIDKDIEDELDDIQALYRAVSLSIQLHTYTPAMKFPEKERRFDYSLGPIDKVLNHYGADGLLLVYGFNEISTPGRKTLQAAGVIIGLFTGIYVVPRSAVTAVSVALVDRTGTIIWYNLKASAGGDDLREAENCTAIVKSAIFDFPALKQ